MSNLSEGVIALISGMGIVFAVLILIALIIWAFKFIKQPGKKEVVVPEPLPVQAPVEVEEETDDLELVAVITAAIAASLNTTTDKLQVKSFRKIGSNRSRW
ncbi:OadG family protein [Vallitalea guaymasensis]|uniref:OadG family protein n=1 Tax=Vallitalea guaymasensis TaxID=1185412 RepID=A0A8J8SEQ2_9FIRM|nr:OadG family protein [Vallitalea guaymasensis]QUH31781.1 OadG family protein [Vallitalea guaymasensis]